MNKVTNLFLLIKIMVLLPFTSYAHERVQLEAVFLYNLSNYIFWENKPDDDIFNICILGKSPLFKTLEKIKEKAKSRGQILNIFQSNKYHDGFIKKHTCHMAYFEPGEFPHNNSNRSFLNKNKVLTVSSERDFVRKGSVEISSLGGKLNLVINTKHLKNAELSASSKLLRLAKVVEL